MFKALLLSATVIVIADDSYRVPQMERAVLEGKCYDREIRLVEERGALSLYVDGNNHDISATAFVRSYLKGSYLGRFTIACKRNGDGFSVNFFGVEIPRTGAPLSSIGSISFNGSMATSLDVAIVPEEDLNLYQFNMRRNEYWHPSLSR